MKRELKKIFDCIKKIKPIKYLLNPILINVMQYKNHPVCLILYIMFISRQISKTLIQYSNGIIYS